MFCIRFEIILIQIEDTVIGINLTWPEIKTPSLMVVNI